MIERMRLGWALTKQSWAVVRDDRTLLLFPIVAAVASLGLAVIFFFLGIGGAAAIDNVWGGAPALVIGVYAIAVVGQFAGVALAHCASQSLQGEQTTFADGFAAARARIRSILLWSLLAVVVGAAISALQSLLREVAGNLLGSILGGILNATWGVATFFVIPILAHEEISPVDAVKRSAGIVKERWGEGVAGSASIGLAIFLLGYLPGIALAAGGLALIDSFAPLGVLVLAAGVVVFVIATVIQIAVSSVFRVALYRFATSGEAVGGFQQDQLANAFRAK